MTDPTNPVPPGGFGPPSAGQTPPPPPLPPAPPLAPAPNGDYPGKTLGIVGLVLAFFANVVGVIISGIALGQSKRAGYRNGAALAGVIIGSVQLVIALVVLGVFLVFGLATGFAAVVFGAAGAGSPSATSAPIEPGPTNPFATPRPTPTPSPGPTDRGQSGSAFDLEVGDCLDEPAGDDITDVLLIDCASPHDWEIYSDIDLPDTLDGAFPGSDKVYTVADEACYDAYEPFTGIAYEESDYDFTYLVPTAESWAEGDRAVSCAIIDPAGPVTGSLEGVGR